MKIKINKYNSEKKSDYSADIPDAAKEVNNKLVAQVLRVETWNNTDKAGKTKTRSEVRGGGRKPWRQKGTGRARAGSIRSPLWKGGAVTFGPTSDDKTLSIPKKMRSLAMLQALVLKKSKKLLAIVSDIKVKDAKTKNASSMISKIFPENEVILVLEPEEAENVIAYRNLINVTPLFTSELKLRDLLSNKAIIFTQKSIDKYLKVKNEKN